MIFIFTLLVIVYYYFTNDSYDSIRKLNIYDTDKKKKLTYASFIGSLLILISSFIFLIIAILDDESYSFNVEEYIGRDSIDNLDKVQDYLDYAIFKTIKKQIPFFDEQQEKVYAQKILMDYLNGNLSSFTRQNQIRNNVKIIGKDKICNLLIKKIIQQKAFNSRVRRILTDEIIMINVLLILHNAFILVIIIKQWILLMIIIY